MVTSYINVTQGSVDNIAYATFQVHYQPSPLDGESDIFAIPTNVGLVTQQNSQSQHALHLVNVYHIPTVRITVVIHFPEMPFT